MAGTKHDAAQVPHPLVRALDHVWECLCDSYDPLPTHPDDVAQRVFDVLRDGLKMALAEGRWVDLNGLPPAPVHYRGMAFASAEERDAWQAEHEPGSFPAALAATSTGPERSEGGA